MNLKQLSGKSARKIKDELNQQGLADLRKLFRTFASSYNVDFELKRVSMFDETINGLNTFWEFKPKFDYDDKIKNLIADIVNFYNTTNSYEEFIEYRNTKIQESAYDYEDYVMDTLETDFAQYLNQQGITRYDAKTIREFLFEVVVVDLYDYGEQFNDLLFEEMGVRNLDDVEKHFNTVSDSRRVKDSWLESAPMKDFSALNGFTTKSHGFWNERDTVEYSFAAIIEDDYGIYSPTYTYHLADLNDIPSVIDGVLQDLGAFIENFDFDYYINDMKENLNPWIETITGKPYTDDALRAMVQEGYDSFIEDYNRWENEIKPYWTSLVNERLSDYR